MVSGFISRSTMGMFALNVVAWALLTIGLLSWSEIYFSGKQTQSAVDPGMVVVLTEDTFDKHVSSGKHFVKFYSPWCAHCYRMAPAWNDLAKVLKQESGVTVSKIDCIKYRGPCQDFEVGGYPVLLWIENGQKIEIYEGSHSLPQMLDFVKKFLGHDEL